MLERIRQILAGYQRNEITDDGFTPAAVLIPLFMKDERLHLLMQRRTEKVDHHKGQIAFPGGRTDPEDSDAVATALREAQEEMGLEPEDVQVLGLIDDIVTVTRFLVTPVVGRIPDSYHFEQNRDEVEEILRVPWELFTRPPTSKRPVEHAGLRYEVEYFPFDGYQIWGATARITQHLVELVEQGLDQSGETT